MIIIGDIAIIIFVIAVVIAADLVLGHRQIDFISSTSLYHLASSTGGFSSSSSFSFCALRFLVSAGSTTWARITAHVPPFP
jgi:hypothetical protein